MNVLNYTKVKKENAEEVIKGLQQLLADYHIFYANLRGMHWNIKGTDFFELHEKYEEMYDYVSDIIDQIAERILQLGGTPANRLSDYLKIARIQEVNEIVKGKDGVASILETLGELIEQQRELLIITDDAGDVTTNSLMAEYLEEQEKKVWMYTAYLS